METGETHVEDGIPDIGDHRFTIGDPTLGTGDSSCEIIDTGATL